MGMLPVQHRPGTTNAAYFSLNATVARASCPCSFRALLC